MLNEHGTNTTPLKPQYDKPTPRTKHVCVRVSDALHKRIKQMAEANYPSVNQACVDVLEHACSQFEARWGRGSF